MDCRPGAAHVGWECSRVVDELSAVVCIFNFMTEAACGVKVKPKTEPEAVAKLNVVGLAISRGRPDVPV